MIVKITILGKIKDKLQGVNTVMSDVKAVYSIKYRVYSKERERKERKRWIPIFMGMTEGGMGMTERDKTGRINPTLIDSILFFGGWIGLSLGRLGG